MLYDSDDETLGDPLDSMSDTSNIDEVDETSTSFWLMFYISFLEIKNANLKNKSASENV